MEHEPIDLRFGQRISPFLFDGVLRREHEKRVRQRKRRLADGDLFFLHRFEQGALHLGWRAVDLVRQDDVGENGASLHAEFAGPRIVNLRAEHVGRQQVGGELDALEVQAKRLGDGANRQRLGEPRNPFQENVSIREKSDQEAVDERPLPDNDFADFEVKRLQAR